MSVTPQVYRFVPGAKTGAAIIDGVKSVMDYTTSGTHHWEVVPGSYVSGTSIALRDIDTGLRRLRMEAATSGTPSPTVDCYYSHDAGVTESHKCWMSGGTTTYALSNGTYGISTTEAYVVEVDDAITIVGAKGTDGGTSLVANSLCMGVHAGRIGSAHNKSDSALGIGEEGMMCGQLMAYDTSRWSMLHDNASGSQTALWTGAGYERACFVVSNTATDWRDKRNSVITPLLENVGDGQSIERLAPFPLIFQTSAGTAFGHVGYTRYIRTRKYGYGDAPSGPPIDNLTVLQSAGDPNIGWRHNYGYASAVTNINTIHIWCPPGDEIVVP